MLLPLLSAPILCGCGVIKGETPLYAYQYEGVSQLCGLKGAGFSEGSILFGTPSVIDLRGLADQQLKKQCITARPEFVGQKFIVKTGA